MTSDLRHGKVGGWPEELLDVDVERVAEAGDRGGGHVEEAARLLDRLRDRADYLVSRYSERKEAAAKGEAARLAAVAMAHKGAAKSK